VLYFRRLPPWDEREVVAAEPRAEELRESIEWK
jgi:hypothetical protein